MQNDPGAGGSSDELLHLPLNDAERAALDALDRYLAGEDARLDAQSPATVAMLGAVREMLRAAPDEISDAVQTQHHPVPVEALMARIEALEPNTQRSGHRQRFGPSFVPWTRSSGQRVWHRVASGIVVCALLGVGVFGGLRRENGSKALLGTTYATHNGERADIRLPDGSHVTLNVASQLNVPSDFGRGHRTVMLTGEALFTVTQRGDVPFTVIAGATTARVLGTTFAVRHYASDTAAMVAVREGKVSVGTVVVTAQHRIDVFSSGRTVVRPSESEQFAFANGVLTLNGVLLGDAIADLNRWYDADIRLASPALGMNRLHASFAADSLEDLAEILASLLDARVVRNGRMLTLSSK